MPNEISDAWKKIHGAAAIKRGNNREQSAQYLAAAGIPYTSNNQGAHLIVEGKDCFIDFWPGTGKWSTRKGKRGFGVRALVLHITQEV